ncbi:hypothetical protein IPL85_06095 [Candidatus Saccharibacteria bacterium]|nr:MAG: hypothetical protein IPL85_06095 [Candidatus Saccharibacteria bacterium]
MKKTWWAVQRFYALHFPANVLAAWRVHNEQLLPFLRWFGRTKTFRVAHPNQLQTDKSLLRLMQSVLLATYAAGGALLWKWVTQGTVGSWAFGLAIIIGGPLLLVTLFVICAVVIRSLYYVIHPKLLGKAIVANILESQVIRLRQKHRFTVVAVAGSVGKTSTKLATAQLLGQNVRVQYQSGNYNDRVTVPLIFFGQEEPPLLNPFAWMRVFGEIAASLHHPYPYDVVVIELGTDKPGQMQRFAYTRPDITVLTAVAPEHMAYFGTLEAVAAEETKVFDYSGFVLVNADAVAPKLLVGRSSTTYSLRKGSAHGYYAESSRVNLGGQFLQIQTPSGVIDAHTKLVGQQGASSVLAAAAVADMLGLKHASIAEAIKELEPSAGRIQVLDGIKNSKLIDDTYNSSPIAVKAALDVVYGSRATQRIAVLGSMNELGAYSKEAHTEVGSYCEPNKLDFVLTLGSDSQRWLAPSARKNGCVVHSFSSQTACAAFVRKHLKTGAVVLVKGSQNGVFAEEVVKQLLAHPRDANKLVRQSSYWLRRKAK